GNELRIDGPVRETHAQPLERAREHDLFDDTFRDEVRAQRVARRRELDFLRTNDGDDFVLTRIVHLLRRVRTHRHRAEADALNRLSSEQQVRRAEERRDESSRGARIQFVGSSRLEQAAEIHDADAIRERKRFLLIVRDQNRRDLELALHLTNRAAQLFADLRIERAERLVEQQHLRLVRERSCNRHALLLSAGELGRQAVVHAFERDEAQQLFAPFDALGGLQATHPQRKFNVLADAHVFEEGVVLKHEPDAAMARGHVSDVAPVQSDAPVIDAAQTRDRTQQRRLAAAARPEQHEELAFRHFERNVVDDGRALIPFGDLVERDRHRGRTLASARYERQSLGGNKSVISGRARPRAITSYPANPLWCWFP